MIRLNNERRTNRLLETTHKLIITILMTMIIYSRISSYYIFFYKEVNMSTYSITEAFLHPTILRQSEMSTYESIVEIHAKINPLRSHIIVDWVEEHMVF